MKFVDVLKAVYSTYHVDFCYIADYIGVDDEVVLNWEKGKPPTEEQLKKFSDLFAIPVSILEKYL